MTALKNILLIVEPGCFEESRWVRSQMDHQSSYQISEVARDQLKESTLLIEQVFATIIFVCSKLRTEELIFLRKISAEAGHVPVLILAAQISIPTYNQIHAMENMVALQNPCNPIMFQSVVSKATAPQRAEFAVCPRFITNEPVRVVVLKTGLHIPTKMRNYSATGAFLEYRGISVKVGDKIRLNLGSETARKDDQIAVEAKVIWISHGDNARSPARGVGIQFDWLSAL